MQMNMIMVVTRDSQQPVHGADDGHQCAGCCRVCSNVCEGSVLSQFMPYLSRPVPTSLHGLDPASPMDNHTCIGPRYETRRPAMELWDLLRLLATLSWQPAGLACTDVALT
jgi:hypothetical protein